MKQKENILLCSKFLLCLLRKCTSGNRSTSWCRPQIRGIPYSSFIFEIIIIIILGWILCLIWMQSILYKQLLWIVLVGLSFALTIQSRSANLGVATGSPSMLCSIMHVHFYLKLFHAIFQSLLKLLLNIAYLQESILLSTARQSTQLQWITACGYLRRLLW